MNRKTVLLVSSATLVILFISLTGWAYFIMQEGDSGEFVIEVSVNYAGLLANETKSIDVKTIGNITLFDLMQENFKLKTKHYPGLGDLITGINNVISDVNISNYYWIFYINGEKAFVGASQYKPTSNDVILWSYEPSFYL